MRMVRPGVRKRASSQCSAPQVTCAIEVPILDARDREHEAAVVEDAVTQNADGYAAVNVNTVDSRRLHDGEEVESASATERRSDTFGVDSWNRWSLPQRSISTVGSRRRASRRARIAEYGAGRLGSRLGLRPTPIGRSGVLLSRRWSSTSDHRATTGHRAGGLAPAGTDALGPRRTLPRWRSTAGGETAAAWRSKILLADHSACSESRRGNR